MGAPRYTILVESCSDGWWWEVYLYSYPTEAFKDARIPVRESVGESPITFASRHKAIEDAQRVLQGLTTAK